MASCTFKACRLPCRTHAGTVYNPTVGLNELCVITVALQTCRGHMKIAAIYLSRFIVAVEDDNETKRKRREDVKLASSSCHLVINAVDKLAYYRLRSH